MKTVRGAHAPIQWHQGVLELHVVIQRKLHPHGVDLRLSVERSWHRVLAILDRTHIVRWVDVLALCDATNLARKVGSGGQVVCRPPLDALGDQDIRNHIVPQLLHFEPSFAQFFILFVGHRVDGDSLPKAVECVHINGSLWVTIEQRKREAVGPSHRTCAMHAQLGRRDAAVVGGNPCGSAWLTGTQDLRQALTLGRST